MVLEELPLHECNQFWNHEQNKVSAFDKLKVLSVTGGVPRYLEEIIPNQSAETNIQKLCFRKESFLLVSLNEFSPIYSQKEALFIKKLSKDLQKAHANFKIFTRP